MAVGKGVGQNANVHSCTVRVDISGEVPRCFPDSCPSLTTLIEFGDLNRRESCVLSLGSFLRMHIQRSNNFTNGPNRFSAQRNSSNGKDSSLQSPRPSHVGGSYPSSFSGSHSCLKSCSTTASLFRSKHRRGGKRLTICTNGLDLEGRCCPLTIRRCFARRTQSSKVLTQAQVRTFSVNGIGVELTGIFSP